MAIKFLSGQTISGTLTVSGNVQGATFNGLAINTTGTNNVANQIVRTQSNGYVNFGWINSVSGNHTGSITRITASNDAYLRYVTPAQFRTGVTDGFYAPSSTVSGVTSVATGNGLTGGTITTTGTLSLDRPNSQLGAVLATYGTTAGSAGRIRCTAPFNTNTGKMFSIEITLYTSYTQHNYVVSAYMYSTINQWYDPKAIYTTTGTAAPDIYVGRDGNGKAYISIANASYTGVLVHNMTKGYQTSLADTYDPWTIAVNSGNENSTSVAVSTVYTSANLPSGSGVTSVNYTHQGNAFTVGGVPVTSSGTIAVTMAGSSSQYINGAGNLISFPTIPPDPTGVYLPLAGGTMTGTITMGTQNFAVAGNYGRGVYGLYNASRFQHLWSMGAAYNLADNGTSTGNLYGVAWSHPNAGGAAANLNDHGMLLLLNGGYQAAISGSIRCVTDMRTPIFYDSNNTNYYVNPGGSSKLADLLIENGTSSNNKIDFTASDTSGYSALRFRYGTAEQNTIHLFGSTWSSNFEGGSRGAINLSAYTGVTFGAWNNLGAWIYNSGQAQFQNSVRSPIFYDSNNTAYYGDFASSTWALNTAGSLKIIGGVGSDGDGASSVNQAVRVSMPNGASYSIDSGVTGAFKIRLPVRANNTMWGMKVRIYSYATNQTSEYTIGNYSYSNGGYNSSVSFQGAENMSGRQVRWGNDGTYDCVWIGETSSSWSYPVVSVMDFNGGFRQGNATTWTNNWDISLVTSFGTVQTAYYPRTQVGQIGYADDSFRTQVFYDSNNTNYYLDPTSTSNLSKAIFNTSGTGLPRQITIKEDGDTENSMGSYPGAWTSALNIQSNDASTYLWFSPLTSNIPRIQTNYGQLDFYTGSNSGRALHLSGTSARSEIFYDLQNTAYYGDFAGTSNLNGLTVAGTITGSIETANKLAITGYQTNGQSFYQTSGSFAGFSGWHNYYIGNHGNGSNYYNTTIAFPFWGPPRYSRLEGGTSRGPYNFLTNENDQTIGVYLQSTTSLRAPIFYDYNNTAFYLDPSTTGTSVNVAGDVVAYASSDIRFKNNITPITNALDKLSKIGGYTFEWNEISHKETGKKDIGVVAQEVEEILPEIVQTRSNGYKAVDYQKLTALLIESVKEQQVIINDLKTRIETLENN